jgi:phosphate:Na+ symporter
MTLNLAVYLLGGIGLFILGMVLMTDGLKSLAGSSLRTALSRFTGGRFQSILSGIGITAVMQSSHATLIATIGFVSAGLLTFEQSIGIVIGSHIGTTSTGWLVAVLGLKMKISMFSLPAIGVGAMMRLLGKERTSNIGLVIAGFGLIFLGIDTLQSGMKDLAGSINLSAFADTGVWSRFILVALGIIMTIVLQSSSAALTITLTALNAGSLSIEQSAALVVGQNVGTTLTAALAAMGGSTAAKRTAAAHIIFNCATAICIFFVLNIFVSTLVFALGKIHVTNPTIILPAFHTAFNIAGMFIALPLIGPFSRMIMKIIPERGPRFMRHIDDSVAAIPAVAIEATRRTVKDITVSLIEEVSSMLEGKVPDKSHILESAENALSQSRLFLSKIRSDKGSTREEQNRHVSVLHVIEHNELLIEECKETEHVAVLRNTEGLSFLCDELSARIYDIHNRLTNADAKDTGPFAAEISQMMTDIRKSERESILKRTALGSINPEEAYSQIEAIRWLDRVTYRIWRAAFHIKEFES